METPICDFVTHYQSNNPLRLHMPGHKGQAILGAEPLDITEIEGADVLYHSSGIIRESEENAAALFGTQRTVYSTEGSSLCIRAMLYLALLHGKKSGAAPLILAGRNAHKVFMTACALLDFNIKWLYPKEETSLLSCEISPEMLEDAITTLPQKPAAVYITSPDYLGNMADVAGLAEVCNKYGILLLVDNAHGAYLHFLPHPCHPMDLGAHLCCDSAHKTLPVLTGGAYLHLSKNAPADLAAHMEDAMALFASTSPSYLILQSLDKANAYLADGYKENLASYIRTLTGFRSRVPQAGGDELLKITFATKKFGFLGTDFARQLQSQGFVCEFADPDYAVMMFTPQIGADKLDQLEKAIWSMGRKPPILTLPPALPHGKQVLTPREALFAPRKILPVTECLGKVLADATVSCPPAIPVLVCGEEIDETALTCFQYYGITHCSVVDA